MTKNQKETWIKQELNKIKIVAKTSDEEAKNILEQRLLDIANSQGITQEEALSVYEKLCQNKKSIG